MQFTIIPDNLYGATARVNGKWLGLVDARPITFTMPDQGEFYLLLELTPLQPDPSGDVFVLPITRVVHIRDGELLAPATEPDGYLHLRRTAKGTEIHYIYPKLDAPLRNLETLPRPVQIESIDLDHDARLDAVEIYATNRSGHIRIRLADGQLLYEDVVPDPKLRVELADLNRDGRPDVLMFWTDPEEQDPLLAPKLQLWESPEGSLDIFTGFTGVKRIGGGDVLLERTRTTPFLAVTDLMRYTRQPTESAHFVPVRREEQCLQRATSIEETAEAYLTALELQDEIGAEHYLSHGTKPKLHPFYAHHIDGVKHSTLQATLYHWIYPNFYDGEKKLHFEFAHHPDKWSDWKITRVVSST
ncbi:VCBS repeat-containing protein [Tumebacillus sp. ITR2]|uniref:VCBS repeat-containing protein n=1 Tax=Tumebacillus amylolyticus TaxID=2801339 RepID=A0ABS1J6D8_9BACL|nr:VCBS repeat-containing protein [Tumebacillus amylolyticus]MBL0385826.1 VCBS repeat-containing protein [Tumebacillus amylolyticus]